MLIPSWIISALWIIGGLVCTYNIIRLWKYNHLTIQFVTRALFIGLLLLAPAAGYFGVTYVYYTNYIIDANIRAVYVRYGLMYLASAFLLWQIIIIYLRGKRG